MWKGRGYEWENVEIGSKFCDGVNGKIATWHDFVTEVEIVIRFAVVNNIVYEL